MDYFTLITTWCWLNFAYLSSAQNYYNHPSYTSMTPEMSAAAASASSAFAAMFTNPVTELDPQSGDDAGAAGPSSGSTTISKGGIIAIGVVVGLVVVFGGMS